MIKFNNVATIIKRNLSETFKLLWQFKWYILFDFWKQEVKVNARSHYPLLLTSIPYAGETPAYGKAHRRLENQTILPLSI